MTILRTLVVCTSLCVFQNGLRAQIKGGRQSQNTQVNNGVNLQVNINASKEQQSTLRQRTEDLAQEIEQFCRKREKDPVEIYWAHLTAVVKDLLNAGDTAKAGLNTPEHDTNAKVGAKLDEWNDQTAQLFGEKYLPNVAALLLELDASGVETADVRRAAVNARPRAVAFALSVAATRIGQHRPYERVLTALEASGLCEYYPGAQFTIYADSSDTNSQSVAKTLRTAFDSCKVSVPKAVLLLPRSASALTGIHVVFPSADWEQNFYGMSLHFSDTGLKVEYDVRPQQPQATFRIEVWPVAKEPETVGPDLFNLDK